MSTVYKTAVTSLITQVVIGIVTGFGYLVQVPNADDRRDLNVILSLELGSQVIEFAWYLVVVCRYSEIKTWTRYLDWVLSTPIMLCSTVLFFSHRNDDLAFVEPFLNPYIYISLGLNWIMLAAGYLVEIQKVSKPIGLSFGSAAFVGSFTALAVHIREEDAFSVGLFWSMYVVWGAYGAAAVLPYTSKNISYNYLDVVSKNFYGLFLFAYTLSLA